MPPWSTPERAEQARPSRLEQARLDAEKLRRKLERTEKYAEMLETIPEQDPWPDGTVLGVKAHGDFTYILLRENGHWYATGNTSIGAPHQLTWAQLVDWFIKVGVRYACEFVQTYRVDLAGQTIDESEESITQSDTPTITLPVLPCERDDGGHHPAHSRRIGGEVAWCPGIPIAT